MFHTSGDVLYMSGSSILQNCSCSNAPVPIGWVLYPTGGGGILGPWKPPRVRECLLRPAPAIWLVQVDLGWGTKAEDRILGVLLMLIPPPSKPQSALDYRPRERERESKFSAYTNVLLPTLEEGDVYLLE